jgi:branched-chain amino acid transport system substrate-binding protein
MKMIHRYAFVNGAIDLVVSLSRTGIRAEESGGTRKSLRKGFHMRKALALVAGALLAVLGSSAHGEAAAPVVKIGVVEPLSGNAAAAGQATKAAIEVAADIINHGYPELARLPIGNTAGLPNLGGAKVEVVFADSQGSPSVGQSETLRLITQEHVVALQGAYHSSVTIPCTAVAERYGIPWMVGDSSSLLINARGFKWTFRSTPIGSNYAAAYLGFLTDLNKSGTKVKTFAIVNENTEYGTSVGGVIRDVLVKGGFTLAAQIPYNANSTDVSAEVLQLKQKDPDVAIFVSYTSDALLFTKTMKTLNYSPRMVIGDDTGFSDPAYIKNVGDIAQGVVNRSAWDIGKPGSATYKINELYKAKTGVNLDDTSGRNMQGFFALMDAINRAGSTKPEAIRKALAETNLTPNQLMMGYRGIRYDATGMNELASTYVNQLQGKEYVTIWPESAAHGSLMWPFKGWR